MPVGMPPSLGAAVLTLMLVRQQRRLPALMTTVYASRWHISGDRGEALSNETKKIRVEDFCCAQSDKEVPRYPSTIDELEIASEGTRRLLFAPLGNMPEAPKLAVVGITPGGQVKKFKEFLQRHSVVDAARMAAFGGAEAVIKELLEAHGFLKALGVTYEGSINDSPDIFTTSLVKCCMINDGSYKFDAPDIERFLMARRCVTERFIHDVERYRTLTHIAIFGALGWSAINAIQVEGRTIFNLLTGRGIKVLNFPHFAQNYQQRELFKLSPEEDAAAISRKPHLEPYHFAAKTMRDAVRNEVARFGGNFHD